MVASSAALTNQANISLNRLQRNSSIELLRILCMFGIILHHCVVHGGFLAASANDLLSLKTTLFGYFVLPAGKIGFTCFVAISMWFFIDKSFKASRFLRIWLEVLFYTFLLAALSCYLGVDTTWQTWVASLLPIGGNSHGFAATYLVFYMFLPFIVKATKNLTRKQTLWLLFALLYVQVIISIFAVLGITNLALHPFPSEILLFMLCYAIMYYFKHWPSKITKHKPTLVLTLIICWLFISVINYCAIRGILAPDLNWLTVLCSNENSIICIIAGISLFFIFNNIHIKQNRIINTVAATTFGILLLHDHNVMRPVFWNNLLHMPDIWLASSISSIVLVLGISALIFIMGFCIDTLRSKLLEKNIIKSTVFLKLTERIDSIFSESSEAQKTTPPSFS